MSKTAVVYWSGTGNTEAMAAAVADGVKAAGGEATLFTAAEFTADAVDSFDAIAFGCPAMGAEVLVEDEFAPCRVLRKQTQGQKDRALRLIRLGRRRMDA